MAIDEGIAANILAAQTQCIGDKVYGNMLLDLGGDAEIQKRAISYLEKKDDIIIRRADGNA